MGKGGAEVRRGTLALRLQEGGGAGVREGCRTLTILNRSTPQFGIMVGIGCNCMMNGSNTLYRLLYCMQNG